jgi:hypothetical protein
MQFGFLINQVVDLKSRKIVTSRKEATEAEVFAKQLALVRSLNSRPHVH